MTDESDLLRRSDGFGDNEDFLKYFSTLNIISPLIPELMVCIVRVSFNDSSFLLENFS